MSNRPCRIFYPQIWVAIWLSCRQRAFGFDKAFGRRATPLFVDVQDCGVLGFRCLPPALFVVHHDLALLFCRQEKMVLIMSCPVGCSRNPRVFRYRRAELGTCNYTATSGITLGIFHHHDGRFGGARRIVGPKRAKIVTANQQTCRPRHGCGVQRLPHPPNIFLEKRSAPLSDGRRLLIARRISFRARQFPRRLSLDGRIRRCATCARACTPASVRPAP